jgi:ABC-2 type transport system permease protein
MSYLLTDSSTMFRRNLLHLIRYPSLTMFVIGMPVIFLLLFVFVFGAVMGDGLGGPTGGRDAYTAFVAPTVMIMSITGAAQGTAISMAMDMTSGLVARLRTMAISRAAVLAGHVLGSVVQSLLAVAIVIAVSLLVGFRPSAGPLGWLAVVGIMTMISFSLTWLSTALGLASRNVESASNTPMVLMLLPFLGSGFVPTQSLPAAIRWFAEYQPFTPFIDVIRNLLLERPLGAALWLTLGWCLLITVGSYLWSVRLYERRAIR